MLLELNDDDARALPYLLDLLAEHEESVIDCGTMGFDQQLPHGDAISTRAVLRSQRIWRRTQKIISQIDAQMPTDLVAHVTIGGGDADPS